MQIIRSSDYLSSLEYVLDFIASDSLNKALIFVAKLDNKIDNLTYMPYKYRKSFYYNNDNARDMIFKGYTVPYLIDTEKNQIVILDIFKWIEQ